MNFLDEAAKKKKPAPKKPADKKADGKKLPPWLDPDKKKKK